MFQFNFKVDSETQDDSQEEPFETIETSIQWLSAQRHEPNSTHIHTILKDCTFEEATVGHTKIRFVNLESTANRMKEESKSEFISHIFKDQTDLVPAVYEGGLKIWECTWDLLQYLSKSDIKFNGKRVLELGCGAGLPALYCALNGSHITLQDYNKEVIEEVTIPNVTLNLCGDQINTDASNPTHTDLTRVTSRAQFYSGDWGSLKNLILNEEEDVKEDRGKIECKFEIILTCETIYNQECHQKLLDLMTSCLQKDGLILLAAKTHYFGVGGGTLQFTQLVKQEGSLDIKTLTTNTEGVKREILEIKFK